ncbi:MAG: glycosyltransferase family 1 protein [Bacteroidota bacterium]
MRNRKIAFDAKRIFNNQTGLGNYSRTLLDNLYRFFPEQTYLLYTPRLPAEKNKYSEHFTTKAANTRFKHLWRSYSIRKDLERDEVDLYHGLSNEIPFWLKNTKTVVTIHDVIFKVLPHTYPPLDRWLYEEKTKYACKHANKIIAISEQTKSDLIRFYDADPTKIEVIYQPCQAIFYEAEKVTEKLGENFELFPNLAFLKNLPSEYLLYVGSIIERKNLLTAVKALELLPEKRRIPLVVVGNGKKYKKKVQNYISQKGLDRWVIWLTDVTSVQALKHLYEKAKLLIYPSHYEGFGLPIVEAMLCQTPVITANLSALKEAGGQSAKLVNPNDLNAISYAILEILEDRNLQRWMGEKGRQEALKRFDPKRLTAEVVKVYQQLLRPNFG